MNVTIPSRIVGPVKIISSEIESEVNIPLATLEAPLWPSVNRGARISRLAGGIKAVVVSECMTRSILLEASDATYATRVTTDLAAHRTQLELVVSQTSKYAKLQNWHTQIVGNLLFIRFAFTTGDAAGHNMTTKAADALIDWLLLHYPGLKYVSISGNYCVDKKVSAVNGILGRGKYVVAEITVPRSLCVEKLRTTPEQIVNLNIKKNLIGSIVAGGVRSANAHFANMLFALYLATGQDVVNIIEGSQGFTFAEMLGGDLYFSVTLPNIILGTVGSGKHTEFVKENLQILGCYESSIPEKNSRKLALIAAATVLCGELSLLAAQTIRGELTKSHINIERKIECD